MSECIVNASVIDTLFLFAELDFYEEWFPNIKEMKV